MMANLDDLQQDWDSQPTYSQERMDQIGNLVRTQADSLRSTLFKRDMVETVAAVFVALCFAPALFYVPSLLSKIGVGIIIGGAVGIIVLMNWVRRRHQADFAALPLKEFLTREVQNLDREIALLRYVAWWYLLPLGVGIGLFVIGLDASKTDPHSLGKFVFSISFCCCYCVFCVIVWWLNQRARKTRLEPLRAVMQRTYESVSEMETLESDPVVEGELVATFEKSGLDLDRVESSRVLSSRVLSNRFKWGAIAAVAVGAITLLGVSWSAFYAIRRITGRDATTHFAAATTLDELVMPMVDAGDLRAVSVGIVSLDEQGNLGSRTRHYGSVKFAQNDSERQPDDQTLYEIGGISKVLTGVALAVAVERGEVALETPLVDLVPPDVRVPSYGEKQINLLHIMTDRSGLPRLANNMPYANLSDPYEDYSSKLANDFLSNYELSGAPGAEYEYSNFAPAYLGYVLTRAAAASDYDALLEDRVTGPLGMPQTRARIANEKSQLPIGYNRFGQATSAWHFGELPGAGGLRSSMQDMSKFMMACIEPPESEIGSAIELAYQQKTKALGSRRAMGLGWQISRDSTRWHNGETGGFHSAMFINRKLKVGVCVLSNRANGVVDELAKKIMEMETRALTTGKPADVATFQRSPKKLLVGKRSQPQQHLGTLGQRLRRKAFVGVLSQVAGD